LQRRWFSSQGPFSSLLSLGFTTGLNYFLDR
jgi:hypothetical protein